MPHIVIEHSGNFDSAIARNLAVEVNRVLKNCGEDFNTSACKSRAISYQNYVMGEDEKIGLEDPENFNRVIGVVQIKNQSLCASAGNRRKWDKYTHIINPKTLESPKNILATWVVASEAIVADAVATCLFFVSPEDLVSQFKFEHLILYADRSVNMSNNFPAQLFT
jgi:thiamine biosynthesis lipoprotein ApbE